jgi:hypothetical protein
MGSIGKPATLAVGLALCGWIVIHLAEGQPRVVGRVPIGPRGLSTAELTDSASFTPVQASKAVTLPQSIFTFKAPFYTVPAGKRLVIEYTTFSVTAPAHSDSAVMRFRLGVFLNGGLVWHDVNTLGANRNFTGASQLVRIYADPRSTIHFMVEREFAPRSTARMSFAGYLVPMGSNVTGRVN